MDKQLAYRQLEYKQKIASTTIPLRLSAYERLAMMCERISPDNLLLRLKTTDGQTVASLQLAMLLAIQQEFDHNLSQQVYISENLWKIVKLSKDNTANLINKIANGLDKNAPAEELANRLLSYLDQHDSLSALQQAQVAIRREAAVLVR